MPVIEMAEIMAQTPVDWNVQGTLTLTLPSPDPRIKPNVILSKEYLPTDVGLDEYFGRIRTSIERRGIPDLQIIEERDIIVSGVRGRMMVCRWDVSAMAGLLRAREPYRPAPEIPPGQVVRQVQVTLLRGRLAINLTASFPDERFAEHFDGLRQLLATFHIS